MAAASPEEAAGPEKPQEVSFAGAFLLKENDNSILQFWNFHLAFFFAKT